MNLCLLAVCLATVAAAPIDTLVVCPAPFRSALEPWVAHRTAQGHHLAFLSSTLSASDLRDAIRRQARQGGLEYVVLVGDAVANRAAESSADTLAVATCQIPAKVTPRFGSEPSIASDNGYADLDDDALPELAVGRLPADTPEELSRMVAKILAYERSTDFGTWRRNVNLVAGLGGFGMLADAAIETAARRIIVGGVPASFSTHVTYGNWRSPYCPNPVQYRQAVLDSLTEGSLCWIYVGHAWPHRLADVEVPGGRFASLSGDDMRQLRSQHGAPIACLLACYTGAFDRPEDCLAEDMLRAPGGPVAVLGGSRVTMPYAMAVLGCELMDEFFAGAPSTLGRAMVKAKQRMLGAATDGSTRQAIDAMAALLNPVDPREELVEHVWLFNLLGDPLLRLRRPQAIRVTSPPQATCGETLEITAAIPIAGRATVELVPRRDRLAGKTSHRGRFELTAQAQAEFAATYRQANDPVLFSANQHVAASDTVLRIAVPAAAEGPCECRIYVEGADDSAAGATSIEIAGSQTAELKADGR
ncbi:MAG TPA: C25 family cysteine peptidase [Pirellulales bacterium]|nr:C25 family cysteine peptidase [Pirellulales bacterium]